MIANFSNRTPKMAGDNKIRKVAIDAAIEAIKASRSVRYVEG